MLCYTSILDTESIHMYEYIRKINYRLVELSYIRLTEMAALVDSSNDDTNRRKWCSISYKIRCFYSKGAFLVLFWMSLIILTFTYVYFVLIKIISLGRNYITSELALVQALPFLLVLLAPIVGWFANARYGNYRVFRVGACLFFSATVVGCICVLILFNVPPHSIVSRVVCDGISLIMYIVGFVGGTACLVTALQLGLDQMPDASSANITSFIAWFVFSIALGAWTLDTSFNFSCVGLFNLHVSFLTSQVFSLIPVIAMSVLCCSLFLLAPKWLIIEPNCPQSLKTIYQVLKFAAKHKAPLNRSALTYWEEDIPSRMDLGKSRYGGPFTTEEVEDVKTFFKILIISLPIFIILCSLSPEIYLDFCATVCEVGLVYSVTYSPAWVIIIVTLVYEFCIYPLIRNRLPSILKRIGIISFLIFIVNSVKLVLAIFIFSYSLELSPWSDKVYSVIFSSIFMFLLNSILEFICAQSPYKMRGLLLGYTMLLYIISIFVGVILIYICKVVCACVGPYCFITERSLFTALSLVGFVLHCLLATWYKRRVREEDYDVHRVVEEVYDRYLSQRPTV